MMEHDEPFPLFMTRAKRELIDSAVFLDFLLPAGAIVSLLSRCGWMSPSLSNVPERWNFAPAELFVWDGLACRECQDPIRPRGLQIIIADAGVDCYILR